MIREATVVMGSLSRLDNDDLYQMGMWCCRTYSDMDVMEHYYQDILSSHNQYEIDRLREELIEDIRSRTTAAERAEMFVRLAEAHEREAERARQFIQERQAWYACRTVAEKIAHKRRHGGRLAVMDYLRQRIADPCARPCTEADMTPDEWTAYTDLLTCRQEE